MWSTCPQIANLKANLHRSFRRLTLTQAHAAAVVSRGAVFWRVKDAVLALRLDGTLEATLEPLPKDWTRRYGPPGVETRVLAVSPDDGRLCVVEAGIRDQSFSPCVEVRVVFREQSGGSGGVAASGKKWNEWASRWDILKLQRPSSDCYGSLTRVCPRGACEKSGLVFLAAAFEATGGRNCEALYALDVGKMKARLLRGIPDPDVGSWCRFGSRASFHGYEMDRVAYITALGKRDGKGNINITMDEGDIYHL
nr:unnamed protein product [Digitaria exilis]